MFHRNRSVLGLLGLALCAALLPGQANVALATGNDYSSQSWLSPIDPRVGENYSLYVKVTNHSSHAIVFTTTVTELPQGDQLISGSQQQRWVGPGQSYTFRFNIYCGVLGGTVKYNLAARWAN